MNIKILILPLVLVVSIAVSIFMIKPGWDNYSANKVRVEKLKAENDSVSRNINSLNSFVDSYKSTSLDLISYVKNGLPIDENSDDFIAELNKNASATNVFISDVSINKLRQGLSKCQKDKKKKASSSKEASGDSYCPPEKTALSVKVKLSGNYLDVKSFVSLLDGQNRVINPISLEINKVNVNKKQVPEENEAGDEESVDQIPVQQAVPGNNSLVNAEVRFDVYYKGNDQGVKLSQLSSDSKVLKKMLTGSLDKGQVDKIRSMVEADLFFPVESAGSGKEDIFN